MEPFELIVMVMIGLFAGLVGGMLGIGGSIIMIPAMTEMLGPNQHLYQAAAMIVNFFVVVPAVYQHRRANAIDSAMVARIMPLAIVGVLVGVGVSELPIFAREGEVYLRGLFGLFLLFVAGYDLYGLYRRQRGGGWVPHPFRRKGWGTDTSTLRQSPTIAAQGWGTTQQPERKQHQWRLAAAVALPTGLVAGLLGIGGGILAVPLQRRFLKVPIRTAIANSASLIVATSFIGAIVKNSAFLAGHDQGVTPPVLAAILIPTAVVGSLIGSRLTHRVPVVFVRVAFFVLLLMAALRLTYKAASSISHPAPPTVMRIQNPAIALRHSR